MSSINNITLNKTIRQQKIGRFENSFLNIVAIFLIIAIFLLIINPTRYLSSILSGTNLFYNAVMPSLLPFFFISKILFNFNFFEKITNFIGSPISKIYKLPKITGYVFLMSILCGYPVGAKLIGELYKDNLIDKQQAKKMTALCSTSGPVFVIGTVGAIMFKDPRLGACIFFIHILSSVITGYVFNIKKDKTNNNIIQNIKIKSTKQNENILSSSVNSTIFSILTVAVYISVFYMFIDMAYDLKILGFISSFFEKLFISIKIDPIFAKGLASGLIEMTRGLSEISSSNNQFLKFVFGSTLVSFGGLSIAIQSLTFLSETKINAFYFFCVKCVQSVITIILSIIFGLFIF